MSSDCSFLWIPILHDSYLHRGGIMNPVKISHSSSTMYNECSHKYYLHYVMCLRPIKQRSALVFGGAIDNGLNAILEGKSEAEAFAIFLDKFTNIKINGADVNLETNPEMVLYSKADHDPKLGNSPRESLIEKGRIMIRDFNKKIMPRIQEVIVVQHPTEVPNADGDKVAGFLDIILRWEDGKVYLMDNKTTSVEYGPNSASESQQLNLYYWAEKDKYKLDGVGFFTLDKAINHNETKICDKCGHNGSGGRAKTCDAIIQKKRCEGDWIISYSPECNINVIINDVSDKVLDETFEKLDNANNGISNEVFEKNEKACWGKFGPCPVMAYCKRGSMDNLTIVEKSEK